MPTNVGFYGWTVPDEFDPPDGPVQFTELVNDITGTVKAIDDRLAGAELRVAALEDKPLVRARRTTALSVVSSGTPTTLPFPVKDEDPTGIADAGGTNFTIKKAGVYYVASGVTWDFNATGARWISLHLGGAIQVSASCPANAAASWTTAVHVGTLLRLAVGNVLTVGIAQSAGVALGTNIVYPAWLTMIWLRP